MTIMYITHFYTSVNSVNDLYNVVPQDSVQLVNTTVISLGLMVDISD